jgi:hypothetical protein
MNEPVAYAQSCCASAGCAVLKTNFSSSSSYLSCVSDAPATGYGQSFFISKQANVTLLKDW